MYEGSADARSATVSVNATVGNASLRKLIGTFKKTNEQDALMARWNEFMDGPGSWSLFSDACTYYRNRPVSLHTVLDTQFKRRAVTGKLSLFVEIRHWVIAT